MRNRKRFRIWTAASALAVTAVTVLALASTTGAAGPNAYVVHNLVADVPGVADHTDPNLVNAWGLDALPTSPWWVSDEGTDLSTIYTADGTKRPLEVTVAGGPTGLVANTGPNFLLPGGLRAIFIWATGSGTIAGWNPGLVPPTMSVVAYSDPDAVYTGLAFSTNRLYAADFANAEVEVLDGNFDEIENDDDFVDPKLPEGYAPFGIQTINGQVFVAYAKQDEDEPDEEVAGQGLGFVDRYDLDGNLLGRVATHGQLNAPWGLAQAPGNFGAFSDDLLVGNFGDGEINAYEPQPDGSYERVGELKTADHKPIEIDGLWALQFGKGVEAVNGLGNTLFFTAGPDDEEHGLFGTIKVSP
jgi:uncharacterized protein (TIGR03118 family)